MPGELVLLERCGIADLIVGNGHRANGGQLVALLPAEQNALRVAAFLHAICRVEPQARKNIQGNIFRNVHL